MKIAIAADHAGYALKESLKQRLLAQGYEIVDTGPHSLEPGDDYPDFTAPAARMVSTRQADRAILICDSGIGVDIVANKFQDVRSALVHTEELARLTREHNDSNVLALGSMFLDEETAERIAKTWLTTEFSDAERHRRRIAKIHELEKQEVDWTDDTAGCD